MYFAKQREIAWLFTPESWWTFWKSSGHLHERGPHKGQYVMARFKDKGPYSTKNVKIITTEANTAERKHLVGKKHPNWGVGWNKGQTRSPETKARMSAAAIIGWQKRRRNKHMTL